MPPGLTLRPAALTDLAGVTDLRIACDIADTGGTEFNRDELLVDWGRNGFSLASDAWVVCTDDGMKVGYGDALCDGKLVRLNPNTCVHPEYRGLGIGTRLLRRAEEWARDHPAASGGHAPIILDQYVDHSNTTAQKLMTMEGYEPVRYHWRMEIDMEGEPPAPEFPEGISPRRFEIGKDDRATHQVIQESFEDIWAHEPQPFEDWELFIPKRVGFDAEASFLATQGEVITGAIMCFVYSPLGWVRQLAVRQPWRGRGLALALLRQVFGEFYRRGYKKVGLVVDAGSLTGATRLYQRAGMHIVQQFDQFQKHLAPS